MKAFMRAVSCSTAATRSCATWVFQCVVGVIVRAAVVGVVVVVIVGVGLVVRSNFSELQFVAVMPSDAGWS